MEREVLIEIWATTFGVDGVVLACPMVAQQVADHRLHKENRSAIVTDEVLRMRYRATAPVERLDIRITIDF